MISSKKLEKLKQKYKNDNWGKELIAWAENYKLPEEIVFQYRGEETYAIIPPSASELHEAALKMLKGEVLSSGFHISFGEARKHPKCEYNKAMGKLQAIRNMKKFNMHISEIELKQRYFAMKEFTGVESLNMIRLQLQDFVDGIHGPIFEFTLFAKDPKTVRSFISRPTYRLVEYRYYD
jgi:hypothetical protein